MSERSISTRYTEAVESFVDLARTMTDEEWATHVPCTPLWTARDVLSHVAGVPDDVLAGRIDGAATDPWTQSQVERNADFGVDELLDRLLGQYELFGSAIDAMGEERPAFDCHTHEHDIRHAIGRPGERNSAIIDDAAELMLLPLSDLPAGLVVTYDDGSEHVIGSSDASSNATLSISKFDVFRSRLGRRTLGQVQAFEWGGDPAAIDTAIAAWFLFGPSEIVVDE